MAVSVNRYMVVVRSEGKALVTPASQWIDAVVLVASTAQTYTLPTGTDPAGGGSQGVNPPPGTTVRASILRITNAMATAGPVYIAFTGTAVIPTASTSTGTSLYVVPAGGTVLTQVPPGTTAISLISTGSGVVTVECWW